MTFRSKWRAERRDLDDAGRRQAPGKFVRLSRGYTHYEIGGPRDSRAVVLIHGFSVPYFIWDPTFVFLTAAGLPVLRYDLYGRGYSDRPNANYGLSLYLQQLRELLDELDLRQADLIGLSMGGPIAAAFCVTEPERAGRLILIGPSGARPIHLGPVNRLATFRGVSEILFRIVGNERMLRALAADFFEPSQVELFLERYRVQMEFRGFGRAILASIRANMLGSFESTYARLGKLGKRILLIWGEVDRAVPFEHSHELRRLLPGAEFMPVAGCGHIPHYEKPELVNPRLLTFLS